MFNKQKTLRDILSDEELPGVNALLHRGHGLIALAKHLSVKEKIEALEGLKTLNRLFFESKQ